MLASYPQSPDPTGSGGKKRSKQNQSPIDARADDEEPSPNPDKVAGGSNLNGSSARDGTEAHEPLPYQNGGPPPSDQDTTTSDGLLSQHHEQDPADQPPADSAGSAALWAQLNKLKPLPTAKGADHIQVNPTPEERLALEELWRNLPEGFKQENRDLILRAYMLASYAHRDMERNSGEPYVTHPISVTQILMELRMDPEALTAGLLHDVAEDTEFSIDYIRQHFGATIAELVDGVTKLKKIQQTKSKSGEPVSNQRAESLRKMMMASIEDLRVLIIKLADRLHNMRTLGAQKDHKRRRIARETLDYYAPIANRLGIWMIKSELEDLSFRYLNPSAYKEIKKRDSAERAGSPKTGDPPQIRGRARLGRVWDSQRRGLRTPQAYLLHLPQDGTQRRRL